MTVGALNLSGSNRLPVIRQNEAAECGLACLAMVASFFGHRTDLATLRRKYAMGLQGMTLRHVVDVASKMQFSNRPIKVPLEMIGQVKLPAILHWDMNHFVVLKSVKGKKLTIHDPAHGERIYTEQEFSKHFTGVALELSPSESFEKQTEKTSLKLTELWGRMFGLKRNLMQVFLLSVVLQIFVLASPFYLQIAVDEVLAKFDTELLLVLALGFAGFALINFAAETIRGYVLLYFGSMMSFQMVGNLFRHLLKLPVDFFEKRHIGDIVSRFSSMEPIKQMLTEGLIASLIDGIMAVTTLILMFVYSPTLAAIALGAWVIYFVIRMAFYRPFRAAQEDAIVSKAKEQTTFIETVRGITSLKLFAGENERENIWQNRYADTINTTAKHSKLSIWFQSANAGIFGLEHILLIYVAAKMVLAGDFTIGMIFAFMAYKRNFTDKASALVEKAIEFKMLSLHLERIADIAHADQEELGEELPDIIEHTALSGGISLKNISYRYADNTPEILKDLNLTIEAGESVAIIGPSGCGKTTLLKVMTGLFKPSSGHMLLDDKPLSDYGVSRYRKQIGVVMQEDDLFAGSIAENIAFFDPEADMQRVIHAAQTAQIHTEIMAMPMKYESLVGDMGAALSGGQKQRIMLARALYRQPKILFMDEGTAHLDVNTEKLVTQAISKLGITRVIIAHRPETIKAADRILEMRRGKIVDATGGQKEDISEIETLEGFKSTWCSTTPDDTKVVVNGSQQQTGGADKSVKTSQPLFQINYEMETKI